MIEPKLIFTSLWAGAISLDIIGIGPFMLTQPIVCGPLFGWWLGHAAVGLIIGAIMQLLWMDVTPVGVGIPFDSTAATILAVYWASLPDSTSISQIVLALLIAVPFGVVFKWLDQISRRWNARFIRRIETVSDDKLPAALTGALGFALGASFTRYVICYALAFWIGQTFWQWYAYTPRMTAFDRGLTMAMILLPVAGLGVCLELLLSDEPDRRWDPLRLLKSGRRKNNE